jgi:hypothetical protein
LEVTGKSRKLGRRVEVKEKTGVERKKTGVERKKT